MTLLELTLVMAVLTMGLVALSQSLVGSFSLNQVNRESALATDGIRDAIERLQGVADFSQVFELYNSDPGDDPLPGAPGATFAVWGLDPLDGIPFVGEIVFPAVDTGAGLELREDVVDPELGMPRDLNGDGVVDAFDHSDDYRILPVLLRLTWKGRSGERTAVARTILADR